MDNLDDNKEVTIVDEDVEDSLDDFENDFYGTAEPKKPEPEEPKETETDDDASEEAEEEDINADDDDADDSSANEEQDDDQPKGGKKTAQDRINELTRARREAERERDEALRKLEEASKSQPKEEAKDEESNESSQDSGPDPDARDENGNLIYPLGEMDPKYIEARVEYLLDQREASREKAREQAAIEKAQEEAARAQAEEWDGKLDAARETYEDFDDKMQVLAADLENLPAEQGQFLADAIRNMDNGTDALYYLADNPEVVDKLISANPVNAAIMLGRLDREVAPAAEPKRATPTQKVTKAKAPPKLNKGNSPRMTVPDDTDDLEAFEDKFFNS